MMTRKHFLLATTQLLLLVGIAGAAYPFISTLNPTARAFNDAMTMMRLPELETGVIERINIQGNELFFLKPNQQQAEAINILDQHVWDASLKNYYEEYGFYAYWGYSMRFGCPLRHQPAQPSQLIERDENAEWLGGYWHWTCEVSYDYAGRAIKTYRYTHNGFNPQYENLETPTILEKRGDYFLISSRWLDRHIKNVNDL